MLVWDVEIDISEKTISRVLFGTKFKSQIELLKFDYQMAYLKKVKQLILEYKLMHFKWLAYHIAEAKEKFKWVANSISIYKHTLNFLAKS